MMMNVKWPNTLLAWRKGVAKKSKEAFEVFNSQ